MPAKTTTKSKAAKTPPQKTAKPAAPARSSTRARTATRPAKTSKGSEGEEVAAASDIGGDAATAKRAEQPKPAAPAKAAAPVTTTRSAFAPIIGKKTSPQPAPAVPEPGTWATMLLGFAVIGWRVRKRTTGSSPLPA